MARDATAGFLSATRADVVRLVYFLQIEYMTGTSRYTSWSNNIYWSPDGGSPSEEWLGLGDLIEQDEIYETAEQESRQTIFTLSGVQAATIARALDPAKYTGQAVTVWFGLLDENHQLIGNPVKELVGLADTHDIKRQGDKVSIRLTVVDERSRWDTPNIRRYTNQDQQERYPGDRGLEFVADQADKVIAWPEEFAS